MVNLSHLDIDTARAIFILFKKNVMGSRISDGEYIHAVTSFEENKQSSNLAQYLYQHKDFITYRTEDDTTQTDNTIGNLGMGMKSKPPPVKDSFTDVFEV